MKRIWIFLVVLLLTFGACNIMQEPELEVSVTTTEENTSIEWPTFAPKDIRLDPSVCLPLDDWGTVGKYRTAYYGISWWINSCADKTKLAEISDQLNQRHYDTEDGYGFFETDEMDLVAVIKYCEIPKEDFLIALEDGMRWALTLRDYDDIAFDKEDAEFPNLGIIYTFDNEIINAYYRRENPVVPEPGTYTTYESYEEYLRANP